MAFFGPGHIPLERPVLHTPFKLILQYLSLEPKCARWDLGHNGKEATSKLHDHGRVSNRQFCTEDFAFLSLAQVSKVHSLMPLGENRPALPPTIF